MNIQLADIWTVTGVVMGFQVTSCAWRISREVKVGQTGDLTWLPPADILNLASMVVAAFGVFILPLLGLVDLNYTGKLLGLALLLFVGYPFALAGHYDMYKNKTPRSYQYFPLQEKIVVIFVIVVAVVYVILAFA
ncbi:MAG: hypothetical protein A2W33_06140 [Chloroflexi bacterium RBG_16_52_11]|nr:MAG: hypothetical protein A2W33_06140 [Chloroflexi bacterium RBG_16_52_11]